MIMFKVLSILSVLTLPCRAGSTKRALIVSSEGSSCCVWAEFERQLKLHSFARLALANQRVPQAGRLLGGERLLQ